MPRYDIDEIAEALKASLRQRDYKKRGYNWYKANSDIITVFSIQRSQYGKELWYYNFGIGINKLEDREISSISRCHIIERLGSEINGKILSHDDLIRIIEHWEENYGDIESLRIRAIENKLPKMTSKQAVEYLTTVKF